jgi:hypothetical protein
MTASSTYLILCAENALFPNHAGSRTSKTLSLLETNLMRAHRREPMVLTRGGEFWTAINYSVIDRLLPEMPPER